MKQTGMLLGSLRGANFEYLVSHTYPRISKLAAGFIFKATEKERNNNKLYYSTVASFYHIWSRERAKYEPIMLCSVPV